mmetsp:Transcript_11955/g.12030  ORF Transcript_11955/g.12030 Transcript_11955/m.12030 type:complete len:406 (+) Transcript_11955:169-1386(+)
MIVLSMSIYFTEVLDFSDLDAGFLIAGFGVSGVFVSIGLGHYIDRYGIKKSLLLANSFGILNFALLFIFENRYAQVFIIYTFCSIALSLQLPTAKLAVKKYTVESVRSLGYSIFYMAIFTGAALSGATVDFILSLGDTDVATFKWVFVVGFFEYVIATIIALKLRELDYEHHGEEEIDLVHKEVTGWEHTKESLSLKSFWRFFILTLLLVIVKAVYKHVFVTLPIFMYREIGEGAHFGYMLAVHKVFMIIAIPLFTMLIYYFNFYTLLAIGSLFSAIAFIPLMIAASYGSVLFFIFLVSLGEAIYAPRLIDYTLQVAPKGREGIFLAVAASPLILSVIVAGLVAGILLDSYCPDDGERECWKMWAWISGMTALMPILMIVFRKYLEQPEHEDEPYMPCANKSKNN